MDTSSHKMKSVDAGFRSGGESLRSKTSFASLDRYTFSPDQPAAVLMETQDTTATARLIPVEE